MKKPRAPKAVSLTDPVLANEGRPDETLNELIAEYKADFEASPLLSSSGKPRRQKRRV
jgi:hypothetical protein